MPPFGRAQRKRAMRLVRGRMVFLKSAEKKVIIAMPVDLCRTLNEEKVTVLCWSVSGLELPARLRAFDYARPEHLKTVLFSGSVMPCKYLRVWQDALPGVRFINQYGPTETTASCTYYEVEGPVEETDVLPIGVPYDNYSVFLLSPEGKAVPDGELGEICVSGPGLGDIGRVREDGLLEFHGRNDRQIKHQGHRVELGEIEVTAMSLPGVAECCAIYKNEKISLVYAGEAKEKEIQLAFRERLPLFMMPRKVVRVDALPRLPNGKKIPGRPFPAPHSVLSCYRYCRQSPRLPALPSCFPPKSGLLRSSAGWWRRRYSAAALPSPGVFRGFPEIPREDAAWRGNSSFLPPPSAGEAPAGSCGRQGFS